VLTNREIESIIQSGEGYNAEFKVSVPNKLKELSEEICAFANAAGGVLLIGVDDSNRVRGVSIDNARRSAIRNSLNEIDPHLPCEMYEVLIQGKPVWIIEVDSGDQKPYALSGAIYVRQASNTQKLTAIEQMRDFFQQSDRIYFDESPCENFCSDLDFNADFFEEFRAEARISAHISNNQVINNLKLTLPKGSFKNGGVLFFAKQPDIFVDTAIIRCLAFEGIDKTYIVDDKRFDGPLVCQYRKSMQWLKNKLNVVYKIEGGGPRTELWEIPEIALKETIINALAHRDYYDKGAVIHIELFADRLEITNPGGWLKQFR
jgi:ATP-dependent DNA helicase RecG